MQKSGVLLCALKKKRFDMKTVYKVSIAAIALVLSGVASSRLFDDGGIKAVMRDEVPVLLNEWDWTNGNSFVRYAAHVPASLAVIVGLRAGDADYDRTAYYDTLTQGIPYGHHDEIMRNSSLAAARRARSRQLRRLAAKTPNNAFSTCSPIGMQVRPLAWTLMPSLH